MEAVEAINQQLFLLQATKEVEYKRIKLLNKFSLRKQFSRNNLIIKKALIKGAPFFYKKPTNRFKSKLETVRKLYIKEE